MRIIELVGVPGCGKSSVIQKSIDNGLDDIILRRDLLNTRIPYTWINRYSINRKLWKSLKPTYYDTNMELKRIYYDRLVQLLTHLAYYSKIKPESVLLLEEGIIQHFTSLEYEGSLDKSLTGMIVEQLELYKPIIVDCLLPVELACKRVNGRGKSGDRYLIQDTCRQVKLMQQKRENIDFVLGLYDGVKYEFNMSNSVDELSAELMRIVGLYR